MIEMWIGLSMAIGIIAGGMFGYIYWVVLKDDDQE